MALGQVILVASEAALGLLRSCGRYSVAENDFEVAAGEVLVMWRSPLLPVSEVVTVIFSLRL